MSHAADAFASNSLASAFANGGHRFPINHQVQCLGATSRLK
jgi:hypothetical protein